MAGNTILIIDDDNRNIFALSAVLRAKGFSIATATTALEGLQLIEKEAGIKVVLLDMMMPDMDGYETLKRLRDNENLQALPVFAVTAQAMVGDRERCLRAGADEYVAKPIDLDLLIHLLEVHNVTTGYEG